MVFPFRYAQEGGYREGDLRKWFFRGSKMPFLMISREKFHKSKDEKTLTIQ